ncbi:glycerol kinase GlpK [Bacteriovorax sp. DB6_IX]|uniref:glycerol kinase GlpK n=1 Tax=Bacteriovorax sp. DB6_IX TaxID=1353530 RepID=UPI00038A366E|nr:glycerol kinase GlpK [Bacteriovorax sp. DB6_IX]EQC51296.1 glycerol kinase [Bacteriovorax sp. DB6_IX]
MFILSIDQGTTGTTAVIINAETFELVGKVNKEYQQIYPEPGWVEHNLNDIWQTVEDTTKEALKKFNVLPNQIKAIGITNQRETTCAFTKDGQPIANAIVWQDRRTSKFCEELKSKGHTEQIHKKTGLTVDPYFSGTKINWLLKNNSSVKEAFNNDDLLIGTIDTFLLYKLTGHVSHKTDTSNASRTMLMNLETTDWDQEMLNLLDVPQNILPEICESIGEFGFTKGLGFLPDGIPISGILGDQQAALFGQACFRSGEGKCTYGTGAFMLVNTGEEIKYSDNGLLTTVAYKYNNKTYYALEGSCYIAGACVQWLRDNLKFFDASPDIEREALKVKNLQSTKDILLLPFFTGLGSPYWKSEAKAALIGLTRDSGVPEISRAALEGIALSINDLIKAMEIDFDKSIETLKVDGGAVANDLLMNIQSSISNIEVIRPDVIETTAYGAAMAAAIGTGLTSMDKVTELWRVDKTFNTSRTPDESSYFSHKSELWTTYIKNNFL